MTYFSGPKKHVLELTSDKDGKLFADVQIEGRPMRMFLDTGGYTILNASLAEELGLELKETENDATWLSGARDKRWTTNVDLKLGELRITDYPVSCVDLSSFERFSKSNGIEEFGGVIGSDLLEILRSTIHYETSRLSIKRPKRQ
ncbi:retropepsin-like aspartic protease [Pelagicoccus sp. SDUM812003]|uniref:retropepsin-like aspartic protease n=1 Tax=Pelagicoccus sp. SDUM812003 TaxID=3041267 RepID=UPI00280F7C23|nr:retropepsin-like aspartic protease [Pelagicoccus sp. SDUM812003]MDQ8203779.1 retropepsin-like aspartic protease [Pelagicoccus sp. SDUM812003]